MAAPNTSTAAAPAAPIAETRHRLDLSFNLMCFLVWLDVAQPPGIDGMPYQSHESRYGNARNPDVSGRVLPGASESSISDRGVSLPDGR